jgi:hypothetical protein
VPERWFTAYGFRLSPERREEPSPNRTIVNWDVAATDWNLLKRRTQDDWVKLSSK